MSAADARPALRRLFGRLRSVAARAAGDTRAVSAVEFALIVPVMLTLLFASVETTQGLQASRKVAIAARTLSDLASQASSIANADMTNILDATADVLAPFPASNAQVVVSGIQTDDKGVSRVVWSDTRGGTRYSCGQVIAIPAELKPLAGTTGFLVLAEVKYAYQPIVGYLISGTITLSDRLYTRPRVGDVVSRTPKQGAACI